MVMCASFSINNNYIELYDTRKGINENVKKLTVPKINKNVESISLFFQSLKKNYAELIDILCVHFHMFFQSFTNAFWKKFVEAAENYGVKKVRIIGIDQIQFCEAVINLSFTPKKDDEIWIFYVIDKYASVTIWKMDENNIWKFVLKEIEFKADKGLTVKTMNKLKSKIKKRETQPYINVYADEINEGQFERIFSFSFFRSVRFCNPSKISKGAMFYALFLAGVEHFLICKCEILLENSLIVAKENLDNIIFSINHKQEKTVLPFSKIISFNVSNNEHLKVYENVFNKFKIVIEEKGRHELLIDIDVNNIYNISVGPVNSCGQNALKFNIPKKLTEYDPILDGVGIDLGTTECCLAVIRKHGPDFVQMDPATHDRSMPSFVAYDEEKPKCGQIVIDRLKHKSQYSVYDVKRIIGKPFEKVTIDPLWPFKVLPDNTQVHIEVETYNGKVIKSCEQITGDLLRHIKEAGSTYQGNIITEAVIAIPSDYNEKQKKATKLAAKYAGFKTIRFIPEPVAAALAYITETPIPENSNILVFDCGGGTVDICVGKVLENQLKVLCYDGDAYLGGRDFDNLLFTHYCATLKHRYNIDVMQSYKKYVLKKKCHEIKHTLSTTEEDWLHVDDFDKDLDDIITITRKEFEEMSSNLILRFKDVVIRAVAKADFQRCEINYVFQVGGGCRMPMIKEMLKEIFPTSIHQCRLYPDWVVAHGAALHLYYFRTRKNAKAEAKTLQLEPSLFTKFLRQLRLRI